MKRIMWGIASAVPERSENGHVKKVIYE